MPLTLLVLIELLIECSQVETRFLLYLQLLVLLQGYGVQYCGSHKLDSLMNIIVWRNCQTWLCRHYIAEQQSQFEFRMSHMKDPYLRI